MIWCLFLFSPLRISALVPPSTFHSPPKGRAPLLFSCLQSQFLPLPRCDAAVQISSLCWESESLLGGRPGLSPSLVASGDSIKCHDWALQTELQPSWLGSKDHKGNEECECALGLSEPQRAVFLTSVECQAWGWG